MSRASSFRRWNSSTHALTASASIALPGSARERQGVVERLARVHEVEEPLEAHALVGHTGCRQLRSRGDLELVGKPVELADVDVAPVGEEGTRGIDDVIGAHEPECREVPARRAARRRSACRAPPLVLLRAPRPSPRRRTTRARRGSAPASARDAADLVGHVRVDEPHDGDGSFLGAAPELVPESCRGSRAPRRRRARGVRPRSRSDRGARARGRRRSRWVPSHRGRSRRVRVRCRPTRARRASHRGRRGRSSHRQPRSRGCRPSGVRCSSGGASSSRS